MGRPQEETHGQRPRQWTVHRPVGRQRLSLMGSGHTVLCLSLDTRRHLEIVLEGSGVTSAGTSHLAMPRTICAGLTAVASSNLGPTQPTPANIHGHPQAERADQGPGRDQIDAGGGGSPLHELILVSEYEEGKGERSGETLLQSEATEGRTQ